VDKLPLSLTQISFGQKFNKLLENLPPSLLSITFTK